MDVRSVPGRSSLPRIEFTEQVMREGMQIESTSISTAEKVELLDLLSDTGVPRIVVGSFVSPKYTPQMADIDALVKGFSPRDGVTYTALALNAKGRERASALSPPLDMTAARPMLYAHICDTFARRNANRSRQDEMDAWPALVDAAIEGGADSAAIGVGAAFGSNFEGAFGRSERMEMLRAGNALWERAGIPVRAVAFADPMGWVTPWAVRDAIEGVLDEWPEMTHFDFHLHDARGLALSSIYEAITSLDERHVVHFDTTAGGIGGCPYCGTGRATGMAATEDFVNMLHQMGLDTGVNLEALIRFVWRLEEVIGHPAFGKVSKAGPHPAAPDQLFDANLPLVETFAESRHFLLGSEVVDHQIRPWASAIPQPQSRQS